MRHPQVIPTNRIEWGVTQSQIISPSEIDRQRRQPLSLTVAGEHFAFLVLLLLAHFEVIESAAVRVWTDGFNLPIGWVGWRVRSRPSPFRKRIVYHQFEHRASTFAIIFVFLNCKRSCVRKALEQVLTALKEVGYVRKNPNFAYRLQMNIFKISISDHI